MDIDLKQGLGEIADDAPTAHLDPDLLWRNGVRRRNRRRVGTVGAVLASVALLTGGVLTVDHVARTDAPPVADDSSVGALPDRVWMPSPWTQGTDKAGDPGRIAVMFWDNGRRRSLGGSEGGGWVTVSALDGKYRYLDADGLLFDGSTPPALSPDGRYVAYPLLRENTAIEGGIARASGWAVYDAQTGRVQEHLPGGAPKGVGASSGLAWTPDSSTLLMDVCTVTVLTDDTQGCDTVRTDVWDVRTGESRALDGLVAGEVVGHSGDDLVVRAGEGRVGVLDLETGEVERLGRAGGGSYADQLVGVDPTRRVATVATLPVDEDGGPGLLTVTTQPLRLGGGVGVTREVVDGARYVDPLEVLDDGRVLATVSTRAEGVTVVLAAGTQVRELVRLGQFGGALPQVAAALAVEPTTRGAQPPDLRDPRAGLGGIALAVCLAGGVGIVAWRRRRGPLGISR